jgi:hypothetical protein
MRSASLWISSSGDVDPRHAIPEVGDDASTPTWATWAEAPTATMKLLHRSRSEGHLAGLLARRPSSRQRSPA